MSDAILIGKTDEEKAKIYAERAQDRIKELCTLAYQAGYKKGFEAGVNAAMASDA